MSEWNGPGADRGEAARAGADLGGSTVERTELGAPDLTPGQVVDLVIACHNARRPVGRAVASVLEGNPAAAVTLVCHNLPAETIRAALDPRHRDRVRYLEHSGARGSASGPFNAGMRHARTPWVSIMGSDDALEPGAVSSWLRLARVTRAEMVMPRLALGAGSRTVPTPPARPSRLLAAALIGAAARRGSEGGRPGPDALSAPAALSGRAGRPGPATRLAIIASPWARADLLADRLSYRSAPLGLLSVAMLRRTGAALVEGVRVGGDVAMVTRLASEVPVAYDAAGPAYVIGEDADDRVTYVLRPMAEQLGFLDALLDEAWFEALSAAARRAVAAKMTRIHVFGAVHYRDEPQVWSPVERASLASTCRHLEAAAPGYTAVLSVAERRLLDACLDPAVGAETLIAASVARRRHGRPASLVPRQATHALAAEAPLRLMTASVLTKALPRLLGAGR